MKTEQRITSKKEVKISNAVTELNYIFGIGSSRKNTCKCGKPLGMDKSGTKYNTEKYCCLTCQVLWGRY